jgi:hypothetical protein
MRCLLFGNMLDSVLRSSFLRGTSVVWLFLLLPMLSVSCFLCWRTFLRLRWAVKFILCLSDWTWKRSVTSHVWCTLDCFIWKSRRIVTYGYVATDWPDGFEFWILINGRKAESKWVFFSCHHALLNNRLVCGDMKNKRKLKSFCPDSFVPRFIVRSWKGKRSLWNHVFLCLYFVRFCFVVLCVPPY